MAIPSTMLLYFLIITLICYYRMPKSWQPSILLLASWMFYASWQPGYLILLGFGIVITRYLVFAMGKSENKKKYLIAGLTYHLGILILFKYLNFFSKTAAMIAGWTGFSWEPWISPWMLPIGISFYTFEAMAMLIDTYRGKVAPANIMDTALYLSFFPTILSGPIERIQSMKPMMREPHHFSFTQLKAGAVLMAYGACKKLAVANVLAAIIAPVFENPSGYAGWPVILSMIGFSLQIYYDFSGYSDMARGMAKLFGYEIMENFKKPYGAISMSDFWRKWHISLSTWFRDYLYIPLGGNRVSRVKRWRNHIIVFGLSGLWHGAAGHFVFWGAYHGVLMALGDVKRQILPTKESTTIKTILAKIWTFILATVGWVFFRAATVKNGILILVQATKNLGASPGGWMYEVGLTDISILMLGFTIVLLGLISYFAKEEPVEEYLMKRNYYLRAILLYAIIFATMLFGSYGYEETTQFIYFQF
ncbi:MAG: MBOAT family protein [Tissierellia bacterium]|nr:MBOAT family protein [Tissierellia bacterium]